MERAHVDDTRASGLATAGFLAALAHELRTPLSALRVSLDLLRDPDASANAEEHRRLAETIDRSLERLERHVTDMLEIGYLERKTLALRSERIDVGTLVAEALDATRQYAIQRRVTIDLTLEDDLPQFKADPARLAQVLTNLLTNAIKFSPLDSSVGLDISTATATTGEAGNTLGEGREDDPADGTGRPTTIVISVSDRGPRIAEGDRGQIFKPFYQVPRRHSEGGAGVGLGLAIAHLLVELHDGRLWVESGEDDGAIFRLGIPIGQDDEDTGS